MVLFRAATMRNRDMCQKCKELDDKIEHYRRIAASITDQVTINRINQLIAEMEALKLTLHSGPLK